MNDTIFKVGDKVWSFSRQEWGEVTNFLSDYLPFQVKVRFKNSTETYSLNGLKRPEDKASDLYFEELQASKLARPLRDKDIVLCYDSTDFGMDYRFYDSINKNYLI